MAETPPSTRARKQRFEKHKAWTADFLRLAQRALRRLKVIEHDYDPAWTPWDLTKSWGMGKGDVSVGRLAAADDASLLVSALFQVYSHRRTGDAPHDKLIDHCADLGIPMEVFERWCIAAEDPYWEWLSGLEALEVRAGTRVRTDPAGTAPGELARAHRAALGELRSALRSAANAIVTLRGLVDDEAPEIHQMYSEEGHLDPMRRELEFILADHGRSPEEILRLLCVEQDCVNPNWARGIDELRYEKELKDLQSRLRSRARWDG